MTKLRSDEETRILRNALRRSVYDNNIRGLSRSSKWASEQLIGLKDIEDEDNMSYLSSCGCTGSEYDMILFCNSLINAGEYQRSAHLMRSKSGKKSLSLLGQFIGFYSLYMTGEKIKDQSITEISGNNKSKHQNPVLSELVLDMTPLYVQNKMDGFLLYLFGVVVRDIRLQGTGNINLSNIPPASQILMESVKLYPCNWSCWLEIFNTSLTSTNYNSESIATSGSLMTLDPTFDPLDRLPFASPEDIEMNNESLPMNPAVAGASPLPPATQSDEIVGYCMQLHYQVHVHLESQLGAQALEYVRLLVPYFPNSLALTTQMAVAHYTTRDYDKAQACFESVRVADSYKLDYIDTYSNILYVREKRADLSHLAHVTTKINKYSPETCCVVGNYYSLKGQHEKAVTYFLRALRLNKKYLSAWTLMGHEYVELRNTSAAVQCYRQAVSVSSIDHRAWYGLGQIYEMLHLYQYGLYYYYKAASIRPSDARMWCAVGNCQARLGNQSAAIKSYERAVDSDDREGVATRELARLYRDIGSVDLAAGCYLRHVLAQTDSSDIDSDMAEALLYLAIYYKTRGELINTENYCSKLLCYAGPEGGEARALLREIRTTTHSL